jgi:hypothetical protein
MKHKPNRYLFSVVYGYKKAFKLDRIRASEFKREKHHYI